jgi:hypothetical protein
VPIPPSPISSRGWWYFVLTRGEAFVDQGKQHYEEQQRQRAGAALRRRATALGFQITPAAYTP